MKILEVNHLSKTYGKGDTMVKALDDVSFTVEQGEFVAIIGPSGSGKSTLLHILGGVDTATSGSVVIGGEDISKLNETALAIFRRRQIGLVYQFYNLIPILTVEENLTLPLLLDGRKPDKKQIESLVNRLGLSNRLTHLPNQLSGGQQQRVSIGRALINNPALMLADEPTGNLDSENSKEIVSLLRQFNKELTLLDEHEDEFAEALEKKTNADSIREKKLIESELQKAIVRNERVAGLYEKLYEDNVEGKVTDEWFMQLSHKYEVERMELKAKIAEYKERLRRLAENNRNKENFITTVRKFMEMKELTPALLHELIERIEVYETEGTGKNRTQRIMIYYRFVGYIEISGGDRKRNHTAETRKGVAVQYLTA